MEKLIILIVEDEAFIRMNARAIIEDAGFVALEASNADDAIVILEGRNDVRAVFTDINMPGSMDGWKLAHAIRDRWPPTHLIITSGKAPPTGGQLPAKARFVPKPYGPEQVAAVLVELFRPDPVPGPMISDSRPQSGRIA